MATVTSYLEHKYIKLNFLMERARVVVAASVDSHSPTTGGDELKHISDRVGSEQQDITPELRSIPVWGSLPGGTAALNRLLAEHASSVSAYTALVIIAVKRFEQIENMLITQPLQLGEMIALWDMLTDSTKFQPSWPANWPQVSKQQKRASITALDNLMTWQLAYTRGPSTAWALTQSSSMPQHLQVRMLGTTEAAMTLTKPLLKLQGEKLHTALAQLPSAFIGNICCFAIETMGPTIRTRAAQPKPPTPQNMDLNQLMGDIQALFLSLADRALPYVETFGPLITTIQHCYMDPDDDSWVGQRSSDDRDDDLRPVMFELAKLTLLGCSAGCVRPAVDPQEPVKLIARNTTSALDCLEYLLGYDGSPLLRMQAQTTQPLSKHVGAPPLGRNLSSGSGSGGGSSSSSSGSRSSSSCSSGSYRSARSDTFEQHLVPRTTTTDPQLLTVLRDCAVEFPVGAFTVIRWLLHSMEGPGDLFPPPALVLSAALCASRHADAWVSRRLPAAKLASLTTERRKRQQKIMLHGSGEMAEVRLLMLELMPMLHGNIVTVLKHPSCSPVRKWLSLPGSVSTLEALLRDSHGPRGAADTLQCALSTTTFLHLVLACSNHTGSTLPQAMALACLSLVSTLFKLFNRLPSHPEAASDDETGYRSYEMLSLCKEGLILVISELTSSQRMANIAPRLGGEGPGTGRIAAALSASATSSSRSGARTARNSQQGSIASPCGTHSGAAAAVCPPVHPTFRLVAVLVMTLAGVLKRKNETARCNNIQFDASDQAKEMEALASFHMHMIPAASMQRVVGLDPNRRVDQIKIWHEIARTQHNGRLLPGCCHMGCTNLAGVSEAALATRLCSGCRQVRYCSNQCQKAAWVGEGHRLVCAKASHDAC